MNEQLRLTLNTQLLTLDRENGSQALSEDCLNAIVQTTHSYTGVKTKSEILTQLIELYDLFLECHPRMANILFDLQHCILALQNSNRAPEEVLATAAAQLHQKKIERLSTASKYALPLLSKGGAILLHSYSASLGHLLERASTLENTPRVIVASQKKEKTDKIIKLLRNLRYKFYVVSEYSISQVLHEITLSIFGGLTLNADGILVLAPGSASLVSQLQAAQIPSYVYLPTNKFSLWQEPATTAFKEVRIKTLDNHIYDKHVFSHDQLHCRNCNGIITERGLLTADEVMGVFRSLQSKFAEHEIAIRTT